MGDKTVWGVLGVIIILASIMGSFSFRENIYGLSFSGVAVLIGILLIAWAFGD